MFLGLRALTSGLRESLLTFSSSQQEVNSGLLLHRKIEDLEMCMGVSFKGTVALFLALQSKLSKSDYFWKEAPFRNLPPP